eukprot:scaffold149719_cov32-Tisochrysis_lutea.AAC.3
MAVMAVQRSCSFGQAPTICYPAHRRAPFARAYTSARPRDSPTSVLSRRKSLGPEFPRGDPRPRRFFGLPAVEHGKHRCQKRIDISTNAMRCVGR